jgi:hypothetical protein
MANWQQQQRALAKDKYPQCLELQQQDSTSATCSAVQWVLRSSVGCSAATDRSITSSLPHQVTCPRRFMAACWLRCLPAAQSPTTGSKCCCRLLCPQALGDSSGLLCLSTQPSRQQKYRLKKRPLCDRKEKKSFFLPHMAALLCHIRGTHEHQGSACLHGSVHAGHLPHTCLEPIVPVVRPYAVGLTRYLHCMHADPKGPSKVQEGR